MLSSWVGHLERQVNVWSIENSLLANPILRGYQARNSLPVQTAVKRCGTFRQSWGHKFSIGLVCMATVETADTAVAEEGGVR